MTEKIRIVITGDSKDGESALKGTSSQASKVEKSFGGASKAASLFAGVLGAISVKAVATKLLSVARQADILSAGLKTATGSAENAAIAFGALEQFASKTPFLLDQSVDAFTRLVNLGLTPSERALISYGDTSASMGKDLMQMIEAVADAATGEFERLKEFGIKAKNQGDTIAFTFRGVTTEVANNAAAIEEHLISLGENNFAGAMADRMATLDGALSNLQDEWDKVFRSISSAGIGSEIEDNVRLGISALQELNAMILSGEIEARLKANASRFESWGGDISTTMSFVRDIFGDMSNDNQRIISDMLDGMSEGFRTFPETVRAFIQLMTVELATFVGKTAAYGEEMLDNLKFWEDESFDLENRLKTLDAVRDQSIESILNEREVAVASYDAQIKGANSLRAKYDELQASKPEVDLGQFGVGAQTGGEGGDNVIDLDQKRFERLQDRFKSENELLAEKLSEEQLILVDALMAKELTEEQFRAQQLTLAEEHEAKLAKIKRKGQTRLDKFNEMSWKGQAKTVFGELANITQGVATHNRGLFELNKIAGISNAIINTYEGASASLKAYPMPLAGIMAAAHVVAGMAQVSAIQSTSFGGSAVSTPSSVGSMPSVNGQAAQPVPSAPSADESKRPPDVNITIAGDDSSTMTKRQLREMVDDIVEEIGDGGYRLNVA